VLAVERFGGGGATAYSAGVIYAAGTRYQAESGVQDNADQMFAYLKAEGSAVSLPTLRRFCDGSNGDMEWLASQGVPHGGNVYHEKTAFPPDGYWLYYSGNEKVPKFKEVATPAPRGHRTMTPGFGGHLFYAKLKASAAVKGVRMLTHSPAQRLITDRQGRVVGVETRTLPESRWKEHDRLYSVVSPWRPLNATRSERAIKRCRTLEQAAGILRKVRARKGVVLSTGGFIYNLELLRKNRPVLADAYQGLLRLGSMGCDGSGIALGQSVGGAVGLMDELFIGRPLSPPESYVEGVMVNAKGERFANEDAYQSLFGNTLARQPEGGKAWLILDDRLFWHAVKQSFFPGKGLFMLWGAPALLNMIMGGTKRARSIEALARKCGVDPSGLERTIRAFNATAREGKPDTLGKASNKMRAIEGRSFYAVNISLNNKFGPTFAFTLGGLLVDEQTGEVRREDGSVIKGVYAAGRAAVGLCSKSYVSGLALADNVFSGRRAGRHAAVKAAFATLPASSGKP
jgi:3-oxo-5alpha-steroid 4-dehydrogenase